MTTSPSKSHPWRKLATAEAKRKGHGAFAASEQALNDMEDNRIFEGLGIGDPLVGYDALRLEERLPIKNGLQFVDEV